MLTQKKQPGNVHTPNIHLCKLYDVSTKRASTCTRLPLWIFKQSNFTATYPWSTIYTLLEAYSTCTQLVKSQTLQDKVLQWSQNNMINYEFKKRKKRILVFANQIVNALIICTITFKCVLAWNTDNQRALIAKNFIFKAWLSLELAACHTLQICIPNALTSMFYYKTVSSWNTLTNIRKE